MDDIPDVICRATKDGLAAQGRVIHIDAAVVVDAYVVRASVGLDEVVRHHEDVVVVDTN